MILVHVPLRGSFQNLRQSPRFLACPFYVGVPIVQLASTVTVTRSLMQAGYMYKSVHVCSSDKFLIYI